MKKIIGVVLVIVITAVVGIWKFGGSKTAKVEYQTAKATKGTLIVSLSASGQVAATNSRTVTTTASGVVKKVYVKEGDKVKTGSPILEIDLDLDGRQKLQSAYSSYQSAQNNLKTAQDKVLSLQSSLVNAKNIFVNQWSMQSPDDPTYIQKHNDYLLAQANYDNQQNAIKQSQTALESARLSYQMAGAVVYAPITGTVTAISLTPGMILNPTSSSSNSSNIENKIAIVNTGATPAITVTLTEMDVPKVRVGDKATITLDALPEKTFSGKVIAVDTTGTVSSGVVSYPTTIQLDSGTTEILSNMSATAEIITDIREGVVMVPATAVTTVNGQSTILIRKEGQVSGVAVEVGISNDSETEITLGINEGDEVVTSVINQEATSESGSTSSPFGGLGRTGGSGSREVIRIGGPGGF